MLLRIEHRTSYEYDAPVQYALLQLRLRPRSDEGQRVLDWRLEIDGARDELQFEDQHENLVDLLSIEPGHHAVHITCSGQVETGDKAGVVGRHTGFAPLWYFERVTELTRPGPVARRLAGQVGDDYADPIARLHALSMLLGETIRYETDRTHAQTTAEDALAAGHGVCQDHAHAFIALARLLGYPARYVSGYLMMNDRVEQDASHAWAEAHVDGIGWVGFDVSNGISPDARYVRVATGLDYRDAAPLSGLRYGASAETMVVKLQVEQ